jgi:hypothetical protein
MADADKKRKVTLRNGSTADVGMVMFAYRLLQGMAEHNSEAFEILLSLGLGEQPAAQGHTIAELKRAGIVARDGALKPLFRDVLVSACKETPEGLVVTSPFAPKDDAEAAYVQGHVTASDNRLIRFARRRGLDRPPENDDGEGPGR